jgi:HSP20 family protein
MNSLVTRNFLNSPLSLIDSVWNDMDDFMPRQSYQTGLDISEDEGHIYVEAAVPGVDPKEIELTYDKGILWIKAEAKNEEKKGRKVYKMAQRSFQYSVGVPGEIDESHDPEATYRNGLMLIKFAKAKKAQPKRIQLKAEN